MSHDHFELLSNQALAACAVTYFLALLAHLYQWAIARSLPITASVPATATATAGGTDTIVRTDQAPGEQLDEKSDRMAMFSRIGVTLTVLGACFHFVAVVSRGLAADPVRVPWGNMYEFTMTGTLVVVVAYLALYRRYSLDWLSPVVTGFVIITLMVDVLFLYTPVVPLRDALQSYWLIIHVVAAILATGMFTIGGMSSALYLIKERWLAKGKTSTGYLARLPDLAALDRMAYRTQAFAFPVWTFAALIAGPIWAQHAWGRYWGWDPKEIWAFITWVVYAAYLHSRATAGWKGRNAAVIALIGLATLWFNFIGINFFFGSGSMHSYAAPVLTVLLH
ncbi:MAG: ccsA 1 [Marmoricola sp.]|nr:ccsA 1 [Marmoricola sp.]